MTAGPVAPVQEPALFTLLAWVRREIEQTLVNLTPSAGVQQVSSLTVESPNLLVNPGAELGDPSLSGYSSVTVPGWTVTGTPTVIEYGTPRRFPWPTASPGPTFPAFLGFPSSNCAPPGSGEQFFGGGPVATSTLTQIVDLRAAASDIDAGTVPYELSGDLGGFTIDPSAASVTVDFLDANGIKLGSGRIRPVTVLDRWFQTQAARTRDLCDDSGGHAQRACGRVLNGLQPGTRQLQQRLRRQPVVHRRRCEPRPSATHATGVEGRPTRSRVHGLHGEQGLHGHCRQPQRAVPQQPHQHLRIRIELLRADPPQRPELLSDPRRIRLRLSTTTAPRTASISPTWPTTSRTRV